LPPFATSNKSSRTTRAFSAKSIPHVLTAGHVRL
jgi:hypothetical protein